MLLVNAWASADSEAQIGAGNAESFTWYLHRGCNVVAALFAVGCLAGQTACMAGGINEVLAFSFISKKAPMNFLFNIFY